MIDINLPLHQKNRYEKVNSIDYAFAKNKQDVIDTSHSNSRNNEHKHSHIREKQIHQTPLSVRSSKARSGIFPLQRAEDFDKRPIKLKIEN